MALACIICEKSEILVKNHDLFHTPLHSTPPLGGLCRNIAILFGTEKLAWCGYATVKKSMTICLAALTEYWHLTDERTDGHLVTS